MVVEIQYDAKALITCASDYNKNQSVGTLLYTPRIKSYIVYEMTYLPPYWLSCDGQLTP